MDSIGYRNGDGHGQQAERLEKSPSVARRRLRNRLGPWHLMQMSRPVSEFVPGSPYGLFF